MNNVFPGAVVHPTTYYGYPYSGSSRRIKPTILGVVHTTETYSVPFPGPSKSWTFSVERDGTVHQFMDPILATPWTNGDVMNPDPALVKDMDLNRYNANEYCFLTIENVNRIADGQRLTQKQLEVGHSIMVWASKLSGLPVDRQRVVGHYQFNGKTRINCPTVPADRERVFNGVLGFSLPDTSMEADMIFTDPIVTQEWDTVPGLASTFTRPDGTTGHFLSVERVKSIAEGSVGGKNYRLLDYGAAHEALVIPRSGLTNPGERFVGAQVETKTVTKEVPTGITQARLDAAVASAKGQGVSEGKAFERDRLKVFLGLDG